MVRLPVYSAEEKNDWKNYATGQKNQRMYPYTGDARNYSNLARMAEQIVGCFGKIDVWINCAGQNKAIGCLWDLDPENLWMETEVNLKSAMNGTHIALKYMCLENNGTILNFCRLIECFDRENLTEMKKNENTEWGLLRIIN